MPILMGIIRRACMPKYKSSNGHHKLFWLVCTPACLRVVIGHCRFSVYLSKQVLSEYSTQLVSGGLAV